MLFAEERKRKIVETIEQNGKATVDQLCREFSVSSATIRADLRDLQAGDLLTRTHGGAIARVKTSFELDSDQREVRNLQEKRRIARAALGLIENGDTIILDTGTTTIELAKLLGERRDLTVVTNDIAIARTLEEVDSTGILLMGGMIRKRFHCTVGTRGADTLSGLLVDKAFMATNSFSVERGAMTPDIAQAETKRLMISIANKVILLCDSSKFGKASFAMFATLAQIDTVVADRIPADIMKKLEESEIEVVLAQS